MEWKEVRLGDVCTRVCSGGTPKSTNLSYYGGEIPWLNTKEIDFNRIYSTEKTITDSGLNNSSAKWIVPNTVTVAMYGATAGKSCIVKVPMTTNQACCNLTINDEVADYEFVYYTLKNDYTTLASLANGGAQQNLNAQIIKDYVLKMPSLADQRRIASILSSLDRKIELNNKINADLEEMAQAIFKNWFVDFEPFKDSKFVDSELGMIPEGWKVGTLKDLLYLRKDSIKAANKGNLPYLPIDTIPMHCLVATDFKSNDEAKSSLQTFEQNDIVVGAMRVYFHRVILAPCKGITRTTCFVLSVKNENALAYSLMQCNQDEAISFAEKTSKGSTMPYAVWDGGYGEYKVVIPPSEVMKSFNDLLSNFFSKMNKNTIENSRLSLLRDTLLPRLMSGELEVPE